MISAFMKIKIVREDVSMLHTFYKEPNLNLNPAANAIILWHHSVSRDDDLRLAGLRPC